MHPKSQKPKVSIVCITYNHEKFIKQALESMLMQKTDFEFEVLVGEDCSTDRTAEIVERIAKKYPEIIKPIYRKRNIGVVKNLVDLMQKAQGEYIALCEGDDFFTNANKIQLQSDFLDKNKDYAICFHLVKVFFEDKEEKESKFPDLNVIKNFNIARLLNTNFIQTNSVMYRKQNYEDLSQEDIMPYDWYLNIYHAQFGKIGFIDKVLSAYRRHPGGVWWNAYKNMNKFLTDFGIQQMAMFFELEKLFGENDKYKKIIYKKVDFLLNEFTKVDKENNNSELEKKAFEKFPLELADFKKNYKTEKVKKWKFFERISKFLRR